MDEWTLNDLLECSVCLERLDTSSKVLPCQHTFCKKCLEEIVNTQKELRCPECRILVDVKIDDLPPNVLLMRILEGMRNSGPNKRISKHENIPQPPSSVVLLSQQPPPPSSCPPSLPPVSAPQQVPLPHSSSVSRTGHHKFPAKPLYRARALYDFNSDVPGDLNFKKGDMILVRNRIDANWCNGECEGRYGTLPVSYIQPLSPEPICKALYDFRMNGEEEDGCLTFNKGDIITAIRRIDENWAEGHRNNKIGIFPLAFVEMSVVAQNLMEMPSNPEAGSSRAEPGQSEDSSSSSPLILTNPLPKPQQSHNPVKSPHVNGATDSSSSTLTSPSSSSTTPTTSSSSTPSSPASPPHNSAPPPSPNRRHSLEKFLQTSNVQQKNTRSSNTTEAPSESSQSQSRSGTSNSYTAAPLQRQSSQRHRRSASSETPPVPGPQLSLHPPLPLPASYVALYPYKPQKADELELKRGLHYTVTERCQDGWFKGISARSHKCGVFPGNYVAPSKSLPALQAQMRGICRSNGTTSQSRSVAPPLEPRSAISYTRPTARHQATATVPGEGSPLRSTNQSSEAQSTAVVAPPNVSVAACTAVKPFEKLREKKDKGGGLMRRLASIKKSKSPPPTAFSMDNPVFEDSSTSSPFQVVHVRSSEVNELIQHRKSNSVDASTSVTPDDFSSGSKASHGACQTRERFVCIVPYPPNSEFELELKLGDIIIVHKKRDDGWYKGTQERTGRTGLFPASFVQSF